MNIATILMIVALVAVFFLMSRSSKKQEREAAAMRDSLQVGDEVTTIGGIIGAIVSIKDETVVIETTKDRTKIRFLKTAIRSVDVRAEDAAYAAPVTKVPAQQQKQNGKNGKKNANKPNAETEKIETVETVETTEADASVETTAEVKLPEENIEA